MRNPKSKTQNLCNLRNLWISILYLSFTIAHLPLFGADLSADALVTSNLATRTLAHADAPTNAAPVAVSANVSMPEALTVQDSVLLNTASYVQPRGDVPMGKFTYYPGDTNPPALGPQWWYDCGVINTNATPNDYAMLTQGQLKWLASIAGDVMGDYLWRVGGMGAEVNQLLGSFSPTNNLFPVTLGQLKATAEPFWNRFITLGISTNFPIFGIADDFAVANIGQAKNLFSFNVENGIGGGSFTWWRLLYGFAPYDSWEDNVDFTGDGRTNQEKHGQGANPIAPPDTSGVSTATVQYIYDDDDRLTATFVGAEGDAAVRHLSPAGNLQVQQERTAQ